MNYIPSIRTKQLYVGFEVSFPLTLTLNADFQQEQRFVVDETSKKF
jgi:hypothetical protein